jgi:hypothetical protein
MCIILDAQNIISAIRVMNFAPKEDRKKNQSPLLTLITRILVRDSHGKKTKGHKIKPKISFPLARKW